MSSKMNRKYSADIKGILNIDTNGIVTIDVEDMSDSIVFSEFIKDFNDKDVKITVAYGEEL